MKYVIAGNYRQFMDWCRECRVSPGDVRYVAGPESLAGIRVPASDFIRVGTWKRRADAYQLIEAVWLATLR